MLALIILCILLTWLLYATICIGMGALLLRGLRLRFSALDALWTGMAVITAILQLYHFLRPIDLVALYLLVALSVAGLIWNRRSLLHNEGEEKKSHSAEVLLCSTAAAIIAFRAAGPCFHYDTGLYGAQAVRWFVTFPLVPGLGNLLGQLGFNSSVFLWIAALDQGPWRDLAHHLFAGFLIAVLVTSIIPAALRIFRAESISPIDWFFTWLFVPAMIWGTTAKIVGTNTDLPTSVICLVAAATLFRGLGGGASIRETSASDTRSINLLVAMVLFSLAVTFKISSLVFALMGWMVAISKMWMVSRNSPSEKRRLMWAVVLSAVLVLPWIVRGVMLTGYPFFPSTAFSIPVDWRVPAFETQMQADFARSFARIPDLTYDYAHGWNWLGPWFRELLREREGFLIPLSFALAGGLAGIVRMMRGIRNSLPQWLWLLVPTLGGLIFWFLEAPAIRFGEPVLWTVGATLGTLAAVQFLDRPWRIRMALAALLLLTAWAAHPRLFWNSYLRPSVDVRTFLRLPVTNLTTRKSISGLQVNMPTETNQCWDAPLPCSPYFRETLHLRRPGRLEFGLASDASEALVRWK